MKPLLIFAFIFLSQLSWAKNPRPRLKTDPSRRHPPSEALSQGQKVYPANKLIPDPPTDIPRFASWAPIGEVVRVPYGWADLCDRQPQECRVDVLDESDLKWSEKAQKIANNINNLVNAELIPTSNWDHWGTMLDHWDYPSDRDARGDCKIYALWKRKLLMDLGFPRQALLMTIVRDQEGNGHTILTLKTDHGEFVLDNMFSEIRPWNATGYYFVKRQSQTDPNVWMSMVPKGEHLNPADEKLADTNAN